jgi:hypothetical protein
MRWSATVTAKRTLLREVERVRKRGAYQSLLGGGDRSVLYAQRLSVLGRTTSAPPAAPLACIVSSPRSDPPKAHARGRRR